MQHARRAAFTLVELLVVIGVLIVLTGILMLGTQHLMSGAKEKATKLNLASATGLLAELDAKTRLSKPPTQWLWTATNSPTPPVVPPVSDLDFWRIPYRDPADPLRNPDAMDAPGSISDSSVEQGGSKAVLNTQLIMTILMSLPTNKASIEKLGQESLFIPDFAAGNTVTLKADGTTLSEAIYYVAGMRVKDPLDGKTYVCIASHASATGASPPSSDNANWVLNTGTAPPLLRDGWGNPIIFVPGTGLRVMHTNGQTAYNAGDVSQLFIDMSPEGKTNRTSTSSSPYVTQPGRPFFASAGPDGDFMKGDDNIYSFNP